jgi:hypothetical protein
MEVEEPRPDPASEARYDAAWREMVGALAEAHYPLTRLTFRSVFGGGRIVTLWLARSPEALRDAPPVNAAVSRARGESRAKDLDAAIEASIVRREAHTVVVRADLSSP